MKKFVFAFDTFAYSKLIQLFATDETFWPFNVSFISGNKQILTVPDLDIKEGVEQVWISGLPLILSFLDCNVVLSYAKEKSSF